VEIEVVIEVAPARRSASKPARGAKKRAATKRRR
jgi:hypothetical protein